MSMLALLLQARKKMDRMPPRVVRMEASPLVWDEIQKNITFYRNTDHVSMFAGIPIKRDEDLTYGYIRHIMSDGSERLFDLRYKGDVMSEENTIPKSLETAEAQAAAVAKTPNRVTLESIKAKIASVEYINPETHPHYTIAIVTMQNGFVEIGTSAPADPANFDAKLGREFSYGQALNAIWKLEGYLLRDKLANEVKE